MGHVVNQQRVIVVGMARDNRGFPVEPVIDLVDDGLSHAEISARFAEWLSVLDTVPVVVLPVTAIDELRNAYAADDVRQLPGHQRANERVPP